MSASTLPTQSSSSTTSTRTSTTLHNPTRSPRIEVRVGPTQPAHLPALAALQRLIFPTLAEAELFTEDHYRAHLDVFPEGQLVALHKPLGRAPIVVGACSALLCDVDFDHPQHTFLEITGGGSLSTHDPNGAWLYGVDMAVHPDYRRRGVARQLYEARRALALRRNLRGEVMGAMLPGYASVRARMSVAAYVDAVAHGRLWDPTLSVQLRQGFGVRGVLHNYLSDPQSDGAAALVVRLNQAYQGA